MSGAAHAAGSRARAYLEAFAVEEEEEDAVKGEAVDVDLDRRHVDGRVAQNGRQRETGAEERLWTGRRRSVDGGRDDARTGKRRTLRTGKTSPSFVATWM